MLGRWEKYRKVSKAMVLLLAMAIAEPYWWNLSGWVGTLPDDSLLLAGAVLLASLTRTGSLLAPAD